MGIGLGGVDDWIVAYEGPLSSHGGIIFRTHIVLTSVLDENSSQAGMMLIGRCGHCERDESFFRCSAFLGGGLDVGKSIWSWADDDG